MTLTAATRRDEDARGSKALQPQVCQHMWLRVLVEGRKRVSPYFCEACGEQVPSPTGDS